MPPFSLETTLVPLTLLILLGWLVGRIQNIDLKSISTMLIYAISPVVAFGSTAQLAFHGTFILLPFITYILAAICGLTSFALGRRLLKHKDMGYLLPQAAGSGNNGYFGLPLAMAIFPPEQVGVYFLIMLGNRYGWRPLPEEASEDEFRRLEQAASSEPEPPEGGTPNLPRTRMPEILRAWYQRDDNAVPPVYLLGSRKKNLTDWLHVLANSWLGENEQHGSHRDRSFLAIDELPPDDALALNATVTFERFFNSQRERNEFFARASQEGERIVT